MTTDFHWPGTRWAAHTLALLLVRPWLWRPALRFVVWTPYPHVPLEYAKFRLTTMYGNSQPTDPMDMIDFLRWCRRFPTGGGATGHEPPVPSPA